MRVAIDDVAVKRDLTIRVLVGCVLERYFSEEE